jgi:hypothetical protein
MNKLSAMSSGRVLPLLERFDLYIIYVVNLPANSYLRWYWLGRIIGVIVKIQRDFV